MGLLSHKRPTNFSNLPTEEQLIKSVVLPSYSPRYCACSLGLLAKTHGTACGDAKYSTLMSSLNPTLWRALGFLNPKCWEIQPINYNLKGEVHRQKETLLLIQTQFILTAVLKRTSIRQVPEFGTSKHYRKAHGISSGWMMCNGTVCCWPITSIIVFIFDHNYSVKGGLKVTDYIVQSTEHWHPYGTALGAVQNRAAHWQCLNSKKISSMSVFLTLLYTLYVVIFAVILFSQICESVLTKISTSVYSYL